MLGEGAVLVGANVPLCRVSGGPGVVNDLLVPMVAIVCAYASS